MFFLSHCKFPAANFALQKFPIPKWVNNHYHVSLIFPNLIIGKPFYPGVFENPNFEQKIFLIPLKMETNSAIQQVEISSALPNKS